MTLLPRVFAAVSLSLVLLTARAAQADEIAPELETLALRQQTQAETNKLVSGLAAKDRRRLTGLYVAFDPNPNDPSAMVACDDDGDYVIVVTDAMLRLISFIARAESDDELDGSHNVEDYAAFLSQSQVPGRRLLPPPPGFFTAQRSATMQDTRLREMLAFLVARELSHLRAGDLVCPHPTATHESGDDEWTGSEQRRAIVTAASVYPGPAAARDIEATNRVLDSGRSEVGALGLLRFFAHANRFLPTYLVQHSSTVARIAAVKQAVAGRHSD